MKKKQLQKDYENYDYLDSKGKVRTKVIYKGKYYDIINEEKHTKFKLLFITINALFIALFLCATIPATQLFKAMYFGLPFCGLVFPIFFLSLDSYLLIVRKTPYKHEDQTKIFENSHIWSIIGLILSGMCLIASIIYSFTTGVNGIDFLPFTANTLLVLLFLSMNLVIKNGRKNIQEKENTDTLNTKEYN